MVLLSAIGAPEDGLRHMQESTAAHVNDTELGNGCLYIAENSVTWLNKQGLGFVLEYPSISLHAVSRDLTAFPKPCLYVMCDGVNLDDEKNDDSDASDGVRDPEPSITEIRFAPSDVDALDTMFQAMSDCQVLHPDEDASFSDEDDDGYSPQEGGFVISAGGEPIGFEQGQDVFVAGNDVERQPDANVGRVTNGAGENMPASEDQFENADDDE